MPVQEKILRVVEYGSFERVGASEPVRVDVRLVGATNADLPAMVAAGEFKPDLLDRLSFEVLFLPALRERGAGDIDLLARHFAARMAMEMRLETVPAFDDAAQEALRGYAWPGNVRELKNVVERAISRAEGETIREVIFDPFRTTAGRAKSPPPSAGATSAVPVSLPVNLPALVAELEEGFVQQALTQSRYRQREAATLLGLSYDQFRGLYRKYQASIKEPPPTAE